VRDVNKFLILTVTLTSGTKLRITKVSLGRLRVTSSLLNITPFVYGTQNGSNGVGEVLGKADGSWLGDELGAVEGGPLTAPLGKADEAIEGELDGDDEGVLLGEEVFSHVGMHGN
jgi:hypothetical protein